jgi:glycosyl transferase family 2
MSRILRQTTVLCAGCALATLYRGVRGTVAVGVSLRWLRLSPTAGTVDHDLRFLLVVPLLREQRVIADTATAFTALARSHAGSTVLLVTTEREEAERADAERRLPELAAALADETPSGALMDRFGGVLPRDRLEHLAAEAGGLAHEACLAAARTAFGAVPTTTALAARLAATEPLITHHHHPRPDGTMADQINDAVMTQLDRLERDHAIDPHSIYVAIYNADSRPEPGTLRSAADTVGRLSRSQRDAPRVMQQSALFVENFDAFGRGPSGCYLRGAAFLQTRWSLAHEIPTWRRQSRAARAGRTARLAHCTGHGLFIRADEFRRWDGLPTDTMNEDLAFGFLLSAARVPIDPIPTIEWADSPETIRQVLRQKRQWFWSYIDHPRIVRMAAQRSLGSRRTRARLATHGALRGAAWLATTPAIAGTLLLPVIRSHRWAAALSIAALASYVALPFALIAAELRRRNRRCSQLTTGELLGGLAAYLGHSLGPAWCCANAIHRAVTGARYGHDKTER